MTNANAAADSSKGEGAVKNAHPPPSAPAGPAIHAGSKVYKSGPLFLSSKGIGWTSWKKRWFILTQTSLVFYRSDPNVAPQKNGEANLTLGGIDLNSSGSVVVKEDKKLITVVFTDGRDGRTFTLKAETLEDLHGWKAALEEALSNAPNAALVVGKHGLLRDGQSNAADVTSEKSKDGPTTVKSLVVGRPILLALEDIDGTPSFLEKALRFIEEYGLNTEGILRQAADVEDVERRIQEYEKGESEFSHEDPHIIADCIKYILRELPSPPVPASCCKALLEAFRADRSMRVNSMRFAICESFPEPNRRLLQRILMMMQAVVSYKAVNRMSVPAVAACMAPLLLRPLLAGDCDIDSNFDVGGDSSVQLLQAAAAANHAQAIVITLLEEYSNIFGDGADTHEPYTDSEESGTESEEITDDGDSFDEEEEDEEDESEDACSDVDENSEHESGSAFIETGEEQYKKKIQVSSDNHCPVLDSSEVGGVSKASPKRRNPQGSLIHYGGVEVAGNIQNPDKAKPQTEGAGNPLHPDKGASESLGADTAEASPCELSHRPACGVRRSTALGRHTDANKNLSESNKISLEYEAEMQNMDSHETDLESKISNEAIAKALLLDILERRKHDLYERHAALEKDVARLKVQLQKEMDLRRSLDAVLRTSKSPVSFSSLVDEKMKAEMEDIIREETDVRNLKKQADDLDLQLHEQRDQNSRIGQRSNDTLHQIKDHQSKMTGKDKQVNTGTAAVTASVSERSSSAVKQTEPVQQNQEAADDRKTINSKAKEVAHNSTASVNSTVSEKPGATTTTKSSSRVEERHSQNATELQSMAKDRHSSHPVPNHKQVKGPDHRHSVEKLHRHQEPKLHASEKSRELERNEAYRNPGTKHSENTDR